MILCNICLSCFFIALTFAQRLISAAEIGSCGSVAQGHGHFLPVFNDRRWLGFDFSCRGMVVYDQPRTALTRKKCPDPLDKNADAEIGSGEELDVDSCPREPGE